MNLLPGLGVLLTGGLVGLAHLQAAVEITRSSQQADGVAITWTTEPGKTYTLLSTASITGAWEELTTLTAAAATLSWTIPEPPGREPAVLPRVAPRPSQGRR